MNVNALLEMGARIFQSSVAGQGASGLSLDAIIPALMSLMSDGKGGLDVAGLMGKMDATGMAAMAQSWLSSGGNQSISASQLMELFGDSKIGAFASALGIDPQTALSGLQDAVPKMVDGASPGGALDALGGLSGAMDMAGKLFGR